MSPLVLFLLLLLLCFGVLVFALKPSKAEEDIERHLKHIGGLYTVDTEDGSILKQEALSSIPWLDNLLRQIPGVFRLRLFIAQSGQNWSVGSLLLGSCVAMFFLGWVIQFWIQIMSLVAIVAIAGGAMPFVYLWMKREARFKRFDTLLPETVDLMSRALRAGHTVTSAIEMVAEEISEPVASEFRIVFEQQNLGLPIREAILNLVERVPLEDVRFLAAAILIQKETGGNLAEVLDKTSAVMRERIRLRGQLRIYTAQGRLTGWILCTLPFLVFLVINLINHDYEKMLLSDPLGLHLVYAGLGMMTIGVLIIRKIINIKV